MTQIDFFFSVGSTYSYLSLMRADAVAAREGVSLVWRPFHVREIMAAMDNRFLAGKPEKYAYMWADIARQAAVLGVPANVPVPHPISESKSAHLVATLGMMEGWGKDYIVTSARRWFAFHEEPGGAANMEASLAVVGQERQAVLARAAAPAVEARLDGETAAARGLGIFGAPTFVVGRELFWGNDRLEHAIAWAKTGRVG